MAHIHQHEHGEDTHRHGHSDGGGSSPPAQEQEHHNCGQNHTHNDILHGGIHRHIDVVRGGIQHRVAHRAVTGLELCHGLHHRVGGGYLVGPRLLGHLEHHAGGAVGFGDGFRVLSLQCNAGHLRQPDAPPGLEGKDQVRHVLHCLKLRVGGNRKGLGAIAHITAGEEQVFRREHLGDVGVGKPESSCPGGVHLHGDLLFHTAGDGHLSHTVDALQGRGYRVLGQGLDGGQILPHEGHHSGGHQVADVDIDDNGVHGPVRKGQPVKLFPQFGGGDVQVGAVHIGNLKLTGPV